MQIHSFGSAYSADNYPGPTQQKQHLNKKQKNLFINMVTNAQLVHLSWMFYDIECIISCAKIIWNVLLYGHGWYLIFTHTHPYTLYTGTRHTFDYIFFFCYSKSLDVIKKNVHNIRLSWLYASVVVFFFISAEFQEHVKLKKRITIKLYSIDSLSPMFECIYSKDKLLVCCCFFLLLLSKWQNINSQ